MLMVSLSDHGHVKDTGSSDGKESARYAGDPSSISWRRKWQPLQYSRLENPMDRGAWWATVHGVTESRTLRD